MKKWLRSALPALVLAFVLPAAALAAQPAPINPQAKAQYDALSSAEKAKIDAAAKRMGELMEKARTLRQELKKAHEAKDEVKLKALREEIRALFRQIRELVKANEPYFASPKPHKGGMHRHRPPCGEDDCRAF